MRSEQINPFIEASVTTFDTMCGVKPVRNGPISLSENGFAETKEIIGIIGLSGGVKGTVLMTMGTETAFCAVSAFLDEEVNEINEDLLDCFAEILNIIAGAAAAKLEGLNVKLAIPTVVTGSSHQIYSKYTGPWVIIPMKFPEWGIMNIEVRMEEV